MRRGSLREANRALQCNGHSASGVFASRSAQATRRVRSALDCRRAFLRVRTLRRRRTRQSRRSKSARLSVRSADRAKSTWKRHRQSRGECAPEQRKKFPSRDDFLRPMDTRERLAARLSSLDRRSTTLRRSLRMVFNRSSPGLRCAVASGSPPRRRCIERRPLLRLIGRGVADEHHRRCASTATLR